jgi:hypothetical protein
VAGTERHRQTAWRANSARRHGGHSASRTRLAPGRNRDPLAQQVQQIAWYVLRRYIDSTGKDKRRICRPAGKTGARGGKVMVGHSVWCGSRRTKMPAARRGLARQSKSGKVTLVRRGHIDERRTGHQALPFVLWWRATGAVACHRRLWRSLWGGTGYLRCRMVFTCGAAALTASWTDFSPRNTGSRISRCTMVCHSTYATVQGSPRTSLVSS